MTEFHRAYGLSIASGIALPELDRCEDPARAPDLTILPDDVPESPCEKDGWRAISPFVQVAEGRFWLHVPGVARFTAEHGRTIRVDPCAGVDEGSVRVFLLGSVLGAILFQRGYLLLHGNAIDIGGRAMVCLGVSGAGKSTLAAAFAARGYRLLSDDVVPVDAKCAAVPGIPRIKLWQDAAERLGVATRSLDRIRPGLAKFNLPMRESFYETPLPIRWVYILAPNNDTKTTLTKVSGLDRFQPLLFHTYRRRFMEGMALHPEHLRRCGDLAGRIHLAEITRPASGFDVDGLVDALLDDVKRVG